MDGNKTLIFTPEIAFNNSTNYMVSVPMTSVSGYGDNLEKDFTYHFTTPIISVQSHSPINNSNDVIPTSIMFIFFNQTVVSSDVVKIVTVYAGKKFLRILWSFD